MPSSREESAIGTIVGIAIIGVYIVWWPHLWLLIIGVLISGFFAAGLVDALRKGSAWRHQEIAIRRLWHIARRMPAGQIFSDPLTRSELYVGRERGSIVLVVTDPPATEAAQRREAMKTTYLLGGGFAPNPPPLFRNLSPIDEAVAVRMPFRKIAAMLRLNAHTGLFETSPQELSDLEELLDRAIDAAQP